MHTAAASTAGAKEGGQERRRLVMESPDMWLVEFYAPPSGHRLLLTWRATGGAFRRAGVPHHFLRKFTRIETQGS